MYKPQYLLCLTSLKLLFWNVMPWEKAQVQFSCKKANHWPLPVNNFVIDTWESLPMEKKCWPFCMMWIVEILTFLAIISRLKLIIVASNNFCSKVFHHRNNRNGLPKSYAIVLRLFRRRARRMQQLMLSLENMKMKGPSFHSPSLQLIGSMKSIMNGSPIPRFLA